MKGGSCASWPPRHSPRTVILRSVTPSGGTSRIPTRRRSTLAHPDGLTARQADVLALLREGLGNKAIAERLSVSPKTVDHHVSAILAKLGVRSRQEAARHAENGEPATPT